MEIPALQQDYYLRTARQVCSDYSPAVRINPSKSICQNCNNRSQNHPKKGTLHIVPYQPFNWPEGPVSVSESHPSIPDSRYISRLRQSMHRQRTRQRGR